MTATDHVTNHYTDAYVRARIEDFLGLDSVGHFTCHHLVTGDEIEPHLHQPQSLDQLYEFFEADAEIFRSLWDRTSVIADLDIEYVNFDRPLNAFLEPKSVFGLQGPVEKVILDLLSGYGIEPLHLLSGRGHHFVWQISQRSRAFQRLTEIGRGPPSLWELSAQAQPPDGASVSEELTRAFSGLGMVMEFLAHRIQEIAGPRCAIPVELTAVEVGPRNYDREMISIDISEYGDPLQTRIIRAPFSFYLKARQQRDLVAAEAHQKLHPLFIIPLQQMSTRDGLKVMRDPKKTAQLARTASTKIPEAVTGTENLISDYMASPLAKFHQWFYSQEPEPEERWPETYDRTPLEILPACAHALLQFPNDLLLRPAHIRRLVRVLLALGWHPRHIAGLITSKYARPFEWTQFDGYDRATRADFYTRLFAGLFVSGRDDLVDFNCVSAQEQGTCTLSGCGFNLLNFKESALERRAHDKLAHRPFNRLFLPSEHS